MTFVPIERPQVISPEDRAVIIEALATALVEAYRADQQTPATAADSHDDQLPAAA